MERLAAEPLVMDPVAAAYDEDGRLYVVEMSDYPYADRANDRPFAENTADPPIGRVRLLIDRDGDGAFDEGPLFAEGLSWPTGVAAWKGGIFVAATPEVWYLKDTDGDGRADVRERLYTGFRKYNVQAVMNNLQWGLDHAIYGAGSGNGGAVRPADRPDAAPVPLLRRDFRFDPATRRFEAISGGARFGNTFDDWGNRFLCDIRNPAEHVVLPAHYLARNPRLPTPRVLHDAAPAGDAIRVFRISPPEPWRALRARRWAAVGKAYPRSELVGAGFLTSSSGVTVYRGDAYPPAYRGNLFLGEVANNLILRQTLEPDGVTFVARRVDAEAGAEFVASTDTWFRPVNFVNAPDGTLHVLDMYRETIEHPWSIPDDIKAQLDLRSGADRGRIYRLAPPGFRAPAPVRLGGATTAALVALLEHPNGWHRDTAHRLLFERQDPAAVAPLRRLLRAGRVAPGPTARAVVLARARRAGGRRPGRRPGRRGARGPRARRAPGRTPPGSIARLAGAGAEAGGGPGRPGAVPGGVHAGRGRGPRAAEGSRRSPAATPPTPGSARPCSARRPAGRGGCSRDLLGDASFAEGPAGPPLLRSLAFEVGAAGRPDEAARVLEALARGPSAEGSRRAARRDAGPRRRPETRRTTALDVRAGTETAALLAGLDAYARGSPPIAPRPRTVASGPSRGSAIAASPRPGRAARPARSARAAAGATGGRPRPGGVPRAGGRDAVAGPLARLLPRVARRGPPAPARPEAPGSGRCWTPWRRRPSRSARSPRRGGLSCSKAPTPPCAPGPAASSRTRHPARAERRSPRYQTALGLAADRGRGEAVFERECMGCHRLGERGHAVGPNLASVQRRTPEEILVHILDPNREVAPEFLEYTVALKDGRVLSGVIAAETATSVTLKRAQEAEDTVLRQEIDEISSTGRSLMPEGLESQIGPQEMADLLAFLLELQQ
jgi:putative membrane-bound dehydrogenase-like protein